MAWYEGGTGHSPDGPEPHTCDDGDLPYPTARALLSVVSNGSVLALVSLGTILSIFSGTMQIGGAAAARAHVVVKKLIGLMSNYDDRGSKVHDDRCGIEHTFDVPEPYSCVDAALPYSAVPALLLGISSAIVLAFVVIGAFLSISQGAIHFCDDMASRAHVLVLAPVRRLEKYGGNGSEKHGDNGILLGLDDQAFSEGVAGLVPTILASPRTRKFAQIQLS